MCCFVELSSYTCIEQLTHKLILMEDKGNVIARIESVYAQEFCDGIWELKVEDATKGGAKLVVTNKALIPFTWPAAHEIIDMQEVVMLHTYSNKLPGSVVEVFDYGCQRGEWAMVFILEW